MRRRAAVLASPLSFKTGSLQSKTSGTALRLCRDETTEAHDQITQARGLESNLGTQLQVARTAATKERVANRYIRSCRGGKEALSATGGI